MYATCTCSDLENVMHEKLVVLVISKTGGSDGLVDELLKYGGSGMVYLLEQLFSVIWRKETVPKQWREGS